ncbi:DUF945 family protein [Gilliamella sp. Pra-s65]|uniref:DUF945 family protein n=1 Tax=unclassified Gilliamella TaxID=2685620 RepID=UPI0013662360|nr:MULTISPECIES: DUF945 family protein [unclassified Gilliamella]MWN89830.1 DUF945 family protein [Gilliamella sp. Pra-s65]MWP73002.1 DUF945 family protein [Gilliamella sp. Pra-s52]
MKKTTLAIGIVAILGIAYVGTAWHTGNIIESNIDNQLAQITNKVNQIQNDFIFTVEKSNYNKGILSTKVHLKVTASQKQSFDETTTPETLFDDDITIHHGPFPIAALAEGTFAPQMAWLEYEMSEQISPQLWKLAGNQPFITGHVGMSYGEYITFKLTNKAIKVTQNEFPIIDGTLELGKGDYTISGYASDSDITTKFKLNKLSFTTPLSFNSEPTSVVINQFVINQKVELNNTTNTANGSFFSHVDSFIYGQQNLGSVTLDFNFDTQGLNKQLFTKQLGMDYPTFDDDIDKKYNIRFSLNKFNWQTPTGNINANLMFDISDIDSEAIDKEDYEKINELKFKLEAPFDVLARLSAQMKYPTANDITSQQITEEKQNIQLMSGFLVHNSPYLTLSNGKTDGFYSDISLTKDSDEVNVNGEKVSKEDFFDNL